ncbi:hypothetical protein DFH08DRAFT_967021 [Mycena albidolilacea]|uniref:Uncharacterized protein n=1 Tax=Mycena albidolilacea TaxID=1033008 RepID=A0AAD6ZMX6_9AGAR|nr:hypothetical protein DFH08DRAFT_967021 [Mycena albidolilacea]
MSTHPEIKDFLGSFPPSLVDLEEVFIKLGIATKGDLLDIAQWEQTQIFDIFAEHFHKGVEDIAPLKAFPAYSLGMRLADNNCNLWARCDRSDEDVE